MNEFQMSLLAADHRRELLAEAVAARLARQARERRSSGTSSSAATSRRRQGWLRLGSLLPRLDV